jgi:hypothetical protein
MIDAGLASVTGKKINMSKKNIKWVVVVDNVITKVVTGKTKKRTYYVSYNAIFSTPHHSIRSKLVHALKDFIKPYIDEMPIYSVPIAISIEYNSKRSVFDLDNKCGIWCKIILDSMKGVKIDDDNVKWVKAIRYVYNKTTSSSDSMEITITPLK